MPKPWLEGVRHCYSINVFSTLHSWSWKCSLWTRQKSLGICPLASKRPANMRQPNPNSELPKCNFLQQGLQALWASKTLWKLSPVHLPLCHAKAVHCLIQLHLPEKKCGRKEASEILRLTITKCCRTSFQSHCFGQTMPSTRATFSAKTGFKDGLWPGHR